MNKRVYLFIPGILQRPDGVEAWADRAVGWVHTHTDHVAEKYEYRAGALTRWLGQSKRVKDCTTLARWYAGRRLVVVAHSNGCEIALRMLRECDDVRAHALHLFAAAADADFDANGLNAALRSGRVGAAHLYGSHNDRTLWAGQLSRRLFGWLGLGYGSLGRSTPGNVDPAVRARVTETWNDRFGHSTWFEPGPFENTMRLVTTGAATEV